MKKQRQNVNKEISKTLLKIQPIKLNRFTTLPVALDSLLNRRFTLLNPNLWADKNDSFSMEHYKIAKGLRSILGLCFSRTSETFHHWKIFADGMSGVCIELNYKKFINSLQLDPRFRYGNVAYKIFLSVDQPPLEVDEIPFAKRYASHDESEFRIIFEDRNAQPDFIHLKFDIKSIQKITLSPWIPKQIFGSVKNLLNSIPGCETIKINSSSLIESENWKKFIAKSESELL
jgi:hypothetical protein